MSSVALSSHMPFPFQRLPPSGLPSPGPHRKVFSTKCGLLLPFSNARRPAVVFPSKRRSIYQFRALTRSRRFHFPTQRPIRLLKPWPPARAPSKPRALSLYHIRTTMTQAILLSKPVDCSTFSTGHRPCTFVPAASALHPNRLTGATLPNTQAGHRDCGSRAGPDSIAHIRKDVNLETTSREKIKIS